MIKIITFIIISSVLNGLNFVIFMTHQDYESVNVFIFLTVFFSASITSGALTSLFVKNLITGFYMELGILDFYYMAFGASAGLCACVVFIFCERNIRIS